METAKPSRHYSLATVVTLGILLAFLGFGVGIRWPNVVQRLGKAEIPQNEALPENLDYRDVEEVYDVLRRKYDGKLELPKLLDGLKSGLAMATNDPYTSYLDETAAQEFQESINGTFSGIGAEIAIKQNQLVIIAPLAGSPAEVAGLQAGDAVLAINKEDTVGLSVEQAVAKIRGEAGTQVTLTIRRGNQAPQDITLARAIIEVPSVKSEVKPSGIGYLQLMRFGPDTKEELRKHITQLKSQGATKFVLDMRNNPGGLLDVAVAVSSEFLANKVIVEERRGDKTIESLKSTNSGLAVGQPLVVLINKGSASASEIVAGALQDHKAATVVGEQSFGKGSVQELVELGGKSYLKVTIAHWFTPSGRNISEQGIAPDAGIERTQADFEADRDPQLAKALELLSQ